MLSFLKKQVQTTTVLPPTVSLDVAPDVGSITQHDHLQLAPSWRVFPAAFWALLIGLGGMYVVSKINTGTYLQSTEMAKTRITALATTIDSVAKETASLKKQVDLATNIAVWTDAGIMLQPFLVEIARICDTRVQINELSITRDDLKSARYAFSLSCMGDARNFDKLEADIADIFKTRGWRHVQVLNTSEGARLTLKFYLFQEGTQS